MLVSRKLSCQILVNKELEACPDNLSSSIHRSNLLHQFLQRPISICKNHGLSRIGDHPSHRISIVSCDKIAVPRTEIILL